MAELNTAFDQSSTLQVPNLKTKLSTPPLHLYLHIPFCHRICPYCSFYKHTPGSTPIGGFIDALAREARHRLSGAPASPRTIYLGGGTPSMLSPKHLTRLFSTLRESIDFSTLDEVTMEANLADDLDADSLDLVELVMALEEEFGVEVNEEELEGITTAGAAYNLITSKL